MLCEFYNPPIDSEESLLGLKAGGNIDLQGDSTMQNSIVLAFVVAAVAVAPVAGMVKAHLDAKANGFRLRNSNPEVAIG